VLLTRKLVISKAFKTWPGSGDATTLKTYKTERAPAGEAKGRETERLEQRVCLVLTCNQQPDAVPDRTRGSALPHRQSR
jgi:hypothetical protein